ncbi:MAG: NAD(P)/FAD-dependent oxidoreductase [bacterium]
MPIEDVIIVGAGPAGIAAAIQLRRQGLDPVIIEKNKIGGLLHNAGLVENYPGFPDSITGPNLVVQLEKQLTQYKPRLVFEEVWSVNFDNSRFAVSTPRQTILSRTLLVASGTSARLFTDIKVPAECRNRILYEVWPIREVEGKDIAIVGSGDAAFDYALSLVPRNRVTILNRSVVTRCLPLLKDRVQQSAYATYRPDTRLTEIKSEGSEKLRLECRNRGEVETLVVDYLLPAVGRKPQLGFLAPQLTGCQEELIREGLLYFAGDVKNGTFRQTGIAVGDGIMSAMKIARKVGREAP